MHASRVRTACALVRVRRSQVILSHIAPFMGSEDEPTGHFNWKQAPRARLLELASRTEPKVCLWLAGHYHENCVARSRSGIEVVTTRPTAAAA